MLLTLSLCICSCTPASRKPDPFLSSAEWQVETDGICFSIRTNADNSDASIRFSEPEILKALEVRIENGSLYAIYDGLETEITARFLANVYPFYEALTAFRTDTDTNSVKHASLGEKDFYASKDADGNYTHIEVKGKDGTHLVFVIRSVNINNDNTTSSGKDPSGSDTP